MCIDGSDARKSNSRKRKLHFEDIRLQETATKKHIYAPMKANFRYEHEQSKAEIDRYMIGAGGYISVAVLAPPGLAASALGKARGPASRCFRAIPLTNSARIV